MAIPVIQPAFASGEVTPSLFGRIDLAKLHTAASTMRNMFVSYRGGAYSRAGTSFVGFSAQTPTGAGVPPRLIPFQFSINQGLCLEFGNHYMRVIADGGFVTEAAETITGAAQADPCEIFVTNSWSNGDWIYITGVNGMVQLNGSIFVVEGATGSSVQLYDPFNNPINSTQYGQYISGGTAARIYTLSTPWADEDLEFLKFTQSADVMTLCCWNQDTGTEYPPYDLARISDDDWTLTATTFAETVSPPSAATAVSSGTGTTNYQYVVTSINPNDGTESVASPIASITNGVDIASTAGSNTVTWSAVAGVNAYNVYAASPGYGAAIPSGSLFGFVGTAYGTQFIDSNTVPDFTQVPPLHNNPFAFGAVTGVNITGGGSGITSITPVITTSTGSGALLETVVVAGALAAVVVLNGGEGYSPADTISFSVNGGATAPTGTLALSPQSGTFPSVPSYFQERRVYASSPNNPDTYWMSQPGAFTNMDSRIPTIATDAIVGAPWSLQVNGVQFLVPMPGGLVVLTGLAAWQVAGAGGSALNPQPISPSDQQAQPQAYNGCSEKVPPIKIEYDILYVQAKGSIVRDLSYNYWINIYTGADITVLSSHLFTGFTIREWAWTEEPYKVLWAIRDDGVLLSLTYLKTQDINGWARHDTFGQFWSCCSVTEPPVDALYVVAQRPIGSVGNAYTIERMDNRIWAQAEDCWCVDCALATDSFYPQTTINASSATGRGAISGATGLVGGNGYSAATTLSVKDPTGSGTVLIPTINGGVITAIAVVTEGSGYTDPMILANDPSGLGVGFAAAATLDNSATFSTAAAVFSTPGSLGGVIRMGGGRAIITGYTSPTEVTGNIVEPIVDLLPNGSTPLAQGSGDWSLNPQVTTVGGLFHLVGQTVTGLADGQVITPRVVQPNGNITLDAPASLVVVGLGFQAQLQSVYLDAGQPTIQGRRKKIAAVTVRVEASRGIKAGTNQPDGSTLSPMRLAPPWTNLAVVPDLGEPPYGSTIVPLYTGDVRVPVGGGIGKPGQVALQQDNPLPLQVLALIPEFLAGDDIEERAEPSAPQRGAPRRAA